MHRLTVVLASTRPGRTGPVIADWFLDQARGHPDFEAQLVDLAEIGLPLLDEPEHPIQRRYRHEHTRRWSAIVDASDAFVLVTPEYNYGIPAALKNAVDYLYWEWAHKPVGFVSYGMASAGQHAVAMLRQVLTPLRMTPVTPTVAIPLRDLVDEQGALHPKDWMGSAAEGMLAELAGHAPALAGLREAGRAADAAAG
ncbi:NADPH-dependent FMN reductase [Brachybacterium sp. P6-10-X1]|uniref:NADPH-dependent FMN reductase n=1 Tax=Brachybacterium sp. P6-10-X1 TaxID=1903186 RepID=UPI0009718724|nr:NAD(P)H-dependent oxidoreductase [Brachybacterium sp. P6-10-X1]APX32027.1 NADPH-dependent FMN reductase [Brachybacterium sp. P6-10-X1]